MRLDDIYIKVDNQMLAEEMMLNQFGIYTQEEKENMTRSFQKAILDYSRQKLMEIPGEEYLEGNLDCIFGRIDKHLSPKTQEKFYQHYVHCMLNFYNNIEGKNVLWELTDDETVLEPRIVKDGTHLTFLQTTKDISNERTALWMNDFLSKKYIRTVKPKVQSKK